jgi:hypothetical protein
VLRSGAAGAPLTEKSKMELTNQELVVAIAVVLLFALGWIAGAQR